MPDLLTRATRLIAVLGSRPLAVADLARMTALPPATTTRLLKRLVALGWADQDGNRGGYRLGPRAFALAAETPYREGLIGVWVPRMRRLAARWPAAGIVLVGLRPWGRHVLWECGAYVGGPAGRLRLVGEDLWSGASGRLLVAHLPARERRTWIDQAGLPAPAAWRGIATRRELLAALADIRREGVCEVQQPLRALWAGAVPAADGAGGMVAVGAYLPITAPREGLVADLRRIARPRGG